MKNGIRVASSAITVLGMSFISAGIYAAETQPTSTTTTTTTGSTMQAQTTDSSSMSGEAFLAANKSKAGVITLPDGLQYKIITPGTGVKPKASDTVTVNYAGRLIDGTEFDSSYKRGEPASFPVSGVIAGWTEALQLMNVGSTWELYIPASLAYGEYGAPPVIGPNQTLIFKVELLGVK